jgi:hypothetical protein
MKFDLLLEELLNEATPEEIYTTYYSKVPPATFIKIISADPQSVVNPGVDTKIENRVKKIGKFSKLLLSLFMKNSLKLEDLDRGTEYLGYLYKHKIAVDISKVNELSDLYDLIKKYLAQDKRDLSTIFQSLSPDEYKILFNGEQWYIIQPLTEKSSCYLGVNTEWCTTWGPYSLNPTHKDKSNYFSRYNTQGALYIIINKTNENDKYQFHFESKQFMNPADKQIDTGDFLDEHTEVRNFFFPSFISTVNSPKQIDLQISRMNVLSNGDSLELMRKTIDKSSLSNPVVASIMSNNNESMNEYIKDEQLLDSVYISGNYIVFNIKSIRNYGKIEDVMHTIDSYNSDISSSYDRVYDDLRDRFYDDENVAGELEPLFKRYYEENSHTLKSELGVFNYEQFKKDYFEPFYTDSQIQEDFLSETTRLNSDSFQSDAQNSVNEIEKYITIEGNRYGYEINLNMVFFIQFLIKNNITKIDDNLFDLIETYIEKNDIQTEYDFNYDYGHEIAGWDDMKEDIENYFDKLIENGDITTNCIEVREKFNDIFSRVFNDNTTFENEHVYVRIKSGIDCDNESVDIEYKNNDTGKIYNGHVKVDNLASYVTNYKLFENFITFKKNIL